MPDEEIEVNAYSGARGEETPRSFVFHGERIEVVRILNVWIEEGHEDRARRRFFELVGSDGYSYKICYDEGLMKWLVKL